MRYNSSGFYEENLSLLGVEINSLPLDEKGEPSHEKCDEFFKTAFENGITLFFVPFSSEGKTEIFLGKNFSEKIRENYFLSGGINISEISSPEEIREKFSERLSALKSVYFDYLVLENISEPFFSESGLYQVFSELKKQGKIKRLGFSVSEKIGSLDKFLKNYSWDFVKTDINFYSWDYSGVNEIYHTIRKRNIPFIASDPFMGGNILNPPEEVFEILKEGDPVYSMQEWALRWFFDKKNMLCVITNPKNPEELSSFADIISSTKTLNSSKKHYVKIASQKIFEEKREGENQN